MNKSELTDTTVETAGVLAIFFHSFEEFDLLPKVIIRRVQKIMDGLIIRAKDLKLL